ncbi:MAG: glycoside hydrolase family 32 protein, partial [Planctomycetes bacterium]|nr:glycoside hydrolase family 32 protein [Planctomycetota bacterium]
MRKRKVMTMKSIVTVMALCIGVTLSLFAGAEADDSAMREKAMAAVRAAIPKAESDPTRPVYHFRPPAQWMSDICGAIYYKGYYHIFYLSNPFSDEGSGKNCAPWAHARSKDLVYWEELPLALLPMKERGERRCNSGCVALDDNNRPMIFYTFVPSRKDATRLGKREQWGAKPLDDDLIKWRRVNDGPLMAAGMNGVPASIKRGWSDPFVFRSDGRTFVTFKDSNGLVCEAQDKELTQWKYIGNIEGVNGECPNFFPMQQKWVLIHSMNPPSYVVGD